MVTFINTQYFFDEITLITNLKVAAVRISVKYKLTICNMYVTDPNIDIQNIFDRHTSLPTPFITFGN